MSALDRYLWRVTYKWAKYGHPNKSTWWESVGRDRYPDADRLLICAGSGRSGGNRIRA